MSERMGIKHSKCVMCYNCPFLISLKMTVLLCMVDWIVCTLHTLTKFICWSPNLQHYLFGYRTFKEVVKVEWGHKRGALIRNDWYLYKKWKGHQGFAQRQGHVSTQWGSIYLQAKDRGLWRKQTGWCLNLRFLVPRTVIKYILVV